VQNILSVVFQNEMRLKGHLLQSHIMFECGIYTRHSVELYYYEQATDAEITS